MTDGFRTVIRSERDRADLAQKAYALPFGWRVEFKPPVRRTSQNAYMWALLDDVAAQKEWHGKKRSSDSWKDLFSAALRQQEIVPGLEGGIVALGARTSEFSPSEMSDMIELIISWGAQNGVTFTDSAPPSAEPRSETADGKAGVSERKGAAP